MKAFKHTVETLRGHDSTCSEIERGDNAAALIVGEEEKLGWSELGSGVPSFTSLRKEDVC